MTEFGLALYNALAGIQIPHERARDVITAMQRDMLTSLATKSDLASLRELLEAKMEIVEARTSARFDNLEAHTSARFDNLEARMTVKLGGIMAAGIGLIAALFVLLRH
jgi:uncharacterized membrane protein YheB (UPF0754 family)